ncbi:MAG: PEP-CTERM sorting domain-containing protein [Aquabacterium sp.]|uniref:PEP-CTERM sorting domain-containing protein n=1 Tax=Aquabacterium sp. TaxID=1872578 RepID=UPI0025B97285|nr:PEP-CTERM sorting domain-containing protein [Aquabacterium sp.]MBI3380434.1 PEP-CTERM sorting domain-containing protein [Aquabacterium sp.]
MKVACFAPVRSALVLACVMSGMAAQAQSTGDLASGSASLSNVAFKLESLAPQPGGATWIQFGQPVGDTVYEQQGWAYTTGQVLREADTGNAVTPYWQDTYFNAPLPGQVSNLAATDGTGTVSVGPNGLSATTRVGADALSKATTWNGASSKVYEVYSTASSGSYLYDHPMDTNYETGAITLQPWSPMQPVQFTLSAHTRLVLEGDAAVQASLAAGMMVPWDDPNSAYNPTVSAFAQLSIGRGVASRPLIGSYASWSDYVADMQDAYAWTGDSVGVYNSMDPATLDPQSRHLSVALVNDSDTEMTGVFLMNVGAGAYFQQPLDVPAIPEPSTYLLMGLGLVGLVWRRRTLVNPS